jgi:hypothetical protein
MARDKPEAIWAPVNIPYRRLPSIGEVFGYQRQSSRVDHPPHKELARRCGNQGRLHRSLLSPCWLPGHRMIVQIQSSWFPLHDRNPQTCVALMWSADFAKKMLRTNDRPSAIWLPVVPGIIGSNWRQLTALFHAGFDATYPCCISGSVKAASIKRNLSVPCLPQDWRGHPEFDPRSMP